MEIVNFLLNISGNSHLHEECKSDIWARTRAPCEAFPSRAQQRSHEVQWPAQNRPRRGGLLRSRCSVLGGWACSQPLCAQLGVQVGRCRCCSARLPPPSRRPTLPTPPTLPSEQLPGAGPSPSLSDLSAGVWSSHKVVLKAQTAYLANNRRETCHVLVLI